MKSFLGIFFFIICSTAVFGQFDKLVKSNSLFNYYKYPVIDKEVYNRLEKDDAIIYLGGYFTTDTSGRITAQKFVPFIDIGNKYELSDSIWQSIVISFATALKDWVFKPVLWEFNGDKKFETAINKIPFQRPFIGKPTYFIIFEVSGVGGSYIHKISFVDAFKISQ